MESLARMMPAAAHRVMVDGRTLDVPVGELAIGDRILVRPGEIFPADGTVEEGGSSADEALLTGESAPVPKQVGSKVVGGSVNGDGAVTVRVQRTGAESYLGQVAELVRQAHHERRGQASFPRYALDRQGERGGGPARWWARIASSLRSSQ